MKYINEFLNKIGRFTMTRTLAAAALLISTLAYGQADKRDFYKNIEGLTVVQSVIPADIIGGFYIGDGFAGNNYKLDSNMTFEKIEFSCLTRSTADSGSWMIINHNTVVLKSKKQTLYFDVVRFDNYYFLIRPAQREKFVKDLQSAIITFKKAKPLIDDGTYSVNNLAGYRLVDRYYAKEIEHPDGL